MSNQTLSILEKRKNIGLLSSDNALSYWQLNIQISKSLASDKHQFNTLHIKVTIEQNKGSKLFARNLAVEQNQLTRLITGDGNIVSSKAEILSRIEKLYSCHH